MLKTISLHWPLLISSAHPLCLLVHLLYPVILHYLQGGPLLEFRPLPDSTARPLSSSLFLPKMSLPFLVQLVVWLKEPVQSLCAPHAWCGTSTSLLKLFEQNEVEVLWKLGMMKVWCLIICLFASGSQFIKSRRFTGAHSIRTMSKFTPVPWGSACPPPYAPI